MDLIPIARIDDPEYVIFKCDVEDQRRKLDEFFGVNANCAENGAPWLRYYAVEANKLVGACSFVSAPVNQMVEIRYLTLPLYENSGVATRMARLLVKMALAEDDGLDVYVLTKPRVNAATTVLRKLGFQLKKPQRVEELGKHHIWHWVTNKSKFLS